METNQKLTEREIDMLLGQRRSLNDCHGACNQGRRKCDTPDACRMPEAEDEDQSQGLSWPERIQFYGPGLLWAAGLVGVLWVMFR